MTGKELSDNLTFLSALKLLEQLVERELLTTEEAEVTHRELARRLRPTLIPSRSLCQFARVSRRFLIGFGE